MDAVHLLSALGLVIATFDYSLLVRRRARQRRQARDAQALGLQGMVRVLLADPEPR